MIRLILGKFTLKPFDLIYFINLVNRGKLIANTNQINNLMKINDNK